ncbi:MAG TPA: dihydrolipoamide acetyltransferase family protein [Stellaceae bacterium]|nr:dihydrolipoamide acetyltransferase family protein [Stellaceae bacterium]
MTIFNLPDLGEGLQEAELVAWHVGAGDHVVADQPLLSVETEKAVVEVPSPQSGRISRLFATPGERVRVGAPLVEFDDGARSDTGTVVGELAAAPPIAAPGGGARPQPGGVRAAPAVRALAQRLGVDLGIVAASGPGGAVTSADVERAARALTMAGPAEPLSGVRRAMAVNMARAHAEIVPATVSDEADVEAWPARTDVTIRLVRAIVAGCVAVPALNAWYDGRNLERRLLKQIDLGLAVDTEDGLFVPVLRNVASRDAADLRRGIEAMKRDLRARSVPVAELRGQTITLSNFGMFAGHFAALVVVPPQVAILGAGRIAPRVVITDGRPAAHRMLPLSLTFDHRAVTGGEAARFLQAALGELERAE